MPTLEYQGTRKSASAATFAYIVAAVVLLAFLLVPTPIYVRQDLGWIDAVSGSRKSQTVWRSGRSTPAVIVESPLAAQYRALGLKWEPDWRNVKGTYLDRFGRNVGSSCGSAPEIYNLVPADLQQSYLAASNDDDVREFFRVMTSGTDAEKTAAVERACDKVLQAYAGTRPGG